MLTQKPYPVDMVVTHHEPHEDEMNANEQARLFGSELFPGIAKAPIMLVDAGLHLDDGHDGDWLLVNRRRLCTGVYGGQFDEHAISKAARVRHSASTRMADFLGRRNDPGLEPLLDYSLRVDRNAGSMPFELANLIKAWWGAGVALYDGMALYRLAFRSLYRMFSSMLPVSEVQPGAFRCLIAEFFVEEFAPKDQKRKLLGTFKTGEDAAVFFKQIGDEVQPVTTLDCRDAGAKSDFDLEGIWGAMVMAGVPLQERRRFVLVSLRSKYKEQLDFLAARREFQEKMTSGEARYLESDRSSYRVALVESDSRLMNRAVRYEDPDCDVLVQCRSDGSAAIRDLRKRLNINPVAAQLRIGDLQKMGRTRRISMADLLSEGTLPHIPSWFNWEEGHGVFCRTYTAKYTPVTRLTRGEIVTRVARGLSVAERDHRVRPIRALRVRLKQKQEAKREAALEAAIDAVIERTLVVGYGASVQL
ncbi:MAG: hypothetical protein AAB375_02760 [Patescibacteria group bacterium]